MEIKKNPREILKSWLSNTEKPQLKRILSDESGNIIKLTGGTIEALKLADSIGYLVIFENLKIEKKDLALIQSGKKFYLDIENYTTFTIKLMDLKYRQVYEGWLITAHFTTKI